VSTRLSHRLHIPKGLPLRANADTCHPHACAAAQLGICYLPPFRVLRDNGRRGVSRRARMVQLSLALISYGCEISGTSWRAGDGFINAAVMCLRSRRASR